jgi:hypothetical protein
MLNGYQDSSTGICCYFLNKSSGVSYIRGDGNFSLGSSRAIKDNIRDKHWKTDESYIEKFKKLKIKTYTLNHI